MSYKKVKTVLVYGKKKCIYMKPKGTREYVKSKGEYVLLPVYVKRVAKKIAAKKLIKNKNGKNGKKKLRGGEHKSKTVKSKTVLSLQVRDVNDKDKKVLDLCEITDSKTELVLLSEEKIERWLVNNRECKAVKIKDKDVNKIKDMDVNDVYLPRDVTKYYYKRNENSKLEEKNDIRDVAIDYKRYYKSGIPINNDYYYIYTKFRNNEKIYSEKDRCELLTKDENGSITFNIDKVKRILFNYKPLDKLYIYDSTGYKEIDIPNYLQGRNIRYLSRDNEDSENPFTYTRMPFFPTPSQQSNIVTADIVDSQKSKSMISKIVDKVKTMRTGSTTPTHATNDPFKEHYKLKDAFQNLLKQKSIIPNIFSRENTGHKKKQMLLEQKLFERSRSSSSRKGRRSSS